MKNIEFQTLANHSSISLEQYLYFKDIQKQYLDNKDITISQVNELKEQYLIQSNNSEINQKTDDSIGLDLLKIKSFYCNYNLFQLLIQNDKFKRSLDNEKNTNSNLFFDNNLNYMVPLLIEKYALNIDFVVKQSIKTTYNNQELFIIKLNNYKLSTLTEQYLCQQVYLHDKKEIAQEMFKKGIVPNAENISQFNINHNEAGDILLKSFLKKKLEQKVEIDPRQKIQNKVKKI